MTGLTSYDVPLLGTLETVPSSLFQNCKSLTAIDLPAAKDLGMNAIRGCDALESISLPNVEKVGNFCFSENPKLKEVDLPKATSLGTKAFDKCTALTTLKLGATTAITLANDTFTSADVPAACNLFLNAAGSNGKTSLGNPSPPTSPEQGRRQHAGALFPCLRKQSPRVPTNDFQMIRNEPVSEHGDGFVVFYFRLPAD